MSAKSKEKDDDDEIKKVDGDPEKEFFVHMLTRDIELADAVLDLLDNCIDGILRNEKPDKTDSHPYRGSWAKISFDDKHFRIEDNCGGIPWDLAKSHAFRMGSRPNQKRPDGSIGVVGIGMKRALFKLGRNSIVHSYHSQRSFEVTIPETWFTSKSWDFPASEEAPITGETGTVIEVTILNTGIKKELEHGKKSDFHERLLSAINLQYCYMLAKGFKVEVNGVAAKGRPVEILCKTPDRNGAFLPYIYEDYVNGVHIFLAVGYTSPNPTEKQQELSLEGQHTSEAAGWTIVCNDRVVVANDKTRLTGWGDGNVPSHHPQFNGIRGIVEFRSKSAANLPVTTTKRGIDAGSNLYLQVREKMQFGLKRFTGNTNRWKGRESDQRLLMKGSEALGLEELKEAVKKGRYSIKLKSIPGTASERQFVPDLPVWSEPKTHRSVSFSRKITEIAAVSLYLFGTDQRSASEVGAACFDRILKEAKK